MDPQFERPIFILSPPRSGSTLLFETLARAPDLYTIGAESHGLIEGIADLHPAARGFESNRLTAGAATAQVVAELRRRFLLQLRDRDSRLPVRMPLRMLEKTPKNALRLPFLRRVFPDAHFVYLHRDPRQTLSSMIEAWQSGRFRTYPRLPGWTGMPWSLLLVPGWCDLIGRPVHEIVAAQWRITNEILLEDFETLPVDRRHVVAYGALLRDPQHETGRLCRELDLRWDLTLSGALPLSRYTVTPPDAGKWRRHRDLIEPMMPGLQPIIARMQRAMGAVGTA